MKLLRRNLSMVLQIPRKTEPPQKYSVMAGGTDFGAGSFKAVVGGTRVRTTSCVVEVTDLEDDLQSTEGGYFYYQGGSREDLIGKQFLTGLLAVWNSPTSHIKISDDPALKAEYSLHLLLGGLATLPYCQEWNLHLVASIHNPKLFKDLVFGKINGSHKVLFGSQSNLVSTVNVNVSLVLPEGTGSYAYCVSSANLIDRVHQAIAIDFGTSTVITTVFAPGGSIVHRQVLEIGGCIDLLSAIATDNDLITFLGTGKVGSTEVIRSGIEGGSFQYGTRAFNFKPLYAKHLAPWLRDRLRLAFKEVAEWRDSAQSFVVWGGGAQLPGVAKILESQGLTPVPEAMWANAIGLERMAQGRLARGK